jgi:NADH-quinone oxidoreductase subunit B
MMEPKYVVAFGTCASCGGFYDNYTTLPGIDNRPRRYCVPAAPGRAVLDRPLLARQIASGNARPAS